MCCYLWVHKKYLQPYIGFVEGASLHHTDLLQEKRTRMKILLIDPHKNIPVKKIDGILKDMVDLYKFLLQSEIFEEAMEDFSPSWIDDDTLIVGAAKKTLKAMPSDDALIYDFNEEDKLTFGFGEELITKTYRKDLELLELIKPMLQNWEADRVATIDLILIKMAVCELTDFPTIPTKVTINEYVDISKMYSTDKSREFVNGILDRMMKKFKEDGTVVKEGRGLLE